MFNNNDFFKKTFLGEKSALKPPLLILLPFVWMNVISGEIAQIGLLSILFLIVWDLTLSSNSIKPSEQLSSHENEKEISTPVVEYRLCQSGL